MCVSVLFVCVKETSWDVFIEHDYGTNVVYFLKEKNMKHFYMLW